MFPAFFSKVNRLGAPITGMIVLGVVQTVLALSTISPTLSEQFSAAGEPRGRHQRGSLHHRALRLDGDDEGGRSRARRSIGATSRWRLVAMLYSVYAIYASGKDAVLGGMLMMGLGFVIWGFIAPRFLHQRRRLQARARCPRRPDRGQTESRGDTIMQRIGSKIPLGHRIRVAAFAIALLAAALAAHRNSAGHGRHPGSDQGDRKDHARLSSRCAAVFLSGGARWRSGLFGRAVPGSRRAGEDRARARRSWRWNGCR